MRLVHPHHVKALTIVNFKNLIRDKMTVFWFLLFPILMTFIFGLVMPTISGPPSAVLRMEGVLDGAADGSYSILKNLPNVTEEKEKSSRQLIQEVNAGLQSIVLLVEGDRVNIHYYRSTENWLSLIKKLIPADKVEATLHDALLVKPVDYILPGMISLTIMQIGMFGGNSLLMDRSRNIVRRLKVNQVYPGDILLAHMLNRMLVVIASTVVLIGAGIVILQAKVNVSNLPMAAVSVLLGGFTFLSIGLLIASIVRSPEAGNLFTQLLNFPMSFLCGVFWPIAIMPHYLQTIAWLFPLTPLVNMIRGTMLTHITWDQWGANALIVLAWGIGSFVLGSLLFKWE